MGRQTVAWSLGVGGVRGAVQVHTMRELARLEGWPDLLLGGSVGSLGLLYASARNLDGLVDEWRSVRNRRFFQRLGLCAPRKWGSGLYDLQPLRKRVMAIVDRQGLDIPAQVGYTRLTDGKHVQVAIHTLSTSAEVADVVIASCTIPGFHTSAYVGGIPAADAGLSRGLLLPPLSSHLRHVHVLSTYPEDRQEVAADEVGHHALRALELTFERITRADYAYVRQWAGYEFGRTVKMYAPKRDLGRAFEAKPEVIERHLTVHGAEVWRERELFF